MGLIADGGRRAHDHLSVVCPLVQASRGGPQRQQKCRLGTPTSGLPSMIEPGRVFRRADGDEALDTGRPSSCESGWQDQAVPGGRHRSVVGRDGCRRCHVRRARRRGETMPPGTPQLTPIHHEILARSTGCSQTPLAGTQARKPTRHGTSALMPMTSTLTWWRASSSRAVCASVTCENGKSVSALSC